LPKGLADSSKVKNDALTNVRASADLHKVLILDPATGTGTFLYSVIKHIAKRFEKNKGMWDGYVSEHLLPRIFGFELLVAPYAVAHLKLGLLLEETGYKFASDERLRIYLNNTLDFVALKEERADHFSAFINKEASAAREIQQDKPVMVILGNPPYSGHSANTGKWINDLLRGADSLNATATENYFMVDGEPLGERNPKWLNDDYVKFIRFAQWRIDQTGYGVLAFVTNHGYLDNPTFRGMRQSLMKSFDEIYILDLHGNSKKKERSPDGSKDENVFDIQQGVSIGIFVKKQCGNMHEVNDVAVSSVARENALTSCGLLQKGGNTHRSSCVIKHKHLYGVREIWAENANGEKELTGGKYQWLANNDVSTTEWKQIEPNKPFYLFTPQDETLREEYQNGWKITEMMPTNNVGIVTSRDSFVSDFELSKLEKRIEDFVDLTKNDNEIKSKYLSANDKLDIDKARKKVNSEKSKIKDFFVKSAYRPFDIRHLFYNDAVIERS
jgi:predicted helicase